MSASAREEILISRLDEVFLPAEIFKRVQKKSRYIFERIQKNKKGGNIVKNTNEKVKVIMDTDIGSDIDDALCLAYLLSQSRCELLGITTGSSEPHKRAELADSICRYIGREVPIYPGRDMPLLGQQRQVAVHQYGVVSNLSHKTEFKSNYAIDFMRETIESNPHEVIILAVGPLTNVGALLAAYPHLVGLIKEISIMGGSYLDSTLARYPIEFNIVNDPTAAKILFDSGVSIRAIGLDVSLATKISCTEFIDSRKVKIMEVVESYAKKFLERTDDMYFHDAISAAILFADNICTYRRGYVFVDMGEEMGKTLFEEDSGGNVYVADNINVNAFFEHYYSVINN